MRGLKTGSYEEEVIGADATRNAKDGSNARLLMAEQIQKRTVDVQGPDSELSFCPFPLSSCSLSMLCIHCSH